MSMAGFWKRIKWRRTLFPATFVVLQRFFLGVARRPSLELKRKQTLGTHDMAGLNTCLPFGVCTMLPFNHHKHVFFLGRGSDLFGKRSVKASVSPQIFNQHGLKIALKGHQNQCRRLRKARVLLLVVFNTLPTAPFELFQHSLGK